MRPFQWPAIDHILTSARLYRRLKEMIFVTASSLNGCHYCGAAHHAFALSIDVTPNQTDDLIKNYTADTADPKDKTAIDFAVNLARGYHSSSEQNFQTF